MHRLPHLSLTDRAENVRRMASGIDVLVVGGGITGAGVALDAAARGLSVAVIDKGDFSSGTSSRSTKLVHGGIRYLSSFDFALTRESLVERGLLLRNAPFLVQPIGFVLPLYKGARRPMGTPIVPPFGVGMGYLLRAGLTMYDLMSGRLSIRRHRKLPAGRVPKMLPCLRTEGLTNAFLYYDGQTDDTRLTLTVLRTAAEHGAMPVNYAELTGFDVQGGRIRSATVVDRLSGEQMEVPVRSVVNAAGVFAQRVEELAGPSSIHISPAKGVHLTVPREALKMGRYAAVLPETDDGRLMFLVPWGPRVTIGTTDTIGGDVDRPAAGPDDLEYLLRHVNRYMSCDLKPEDVISAWAGYRPLLSAKNGDEVSSARLSRTHAVIDGPAGMVSIVGGKLTTYRRMAQDTMDRVDGILGREPQHATRDLPLSGSDGWRSAIEKLKEDGPGLGLGMDTVKRLANYGSQGTLILDLVREDRALAERIVPDLPYIMAEVVYACRYEMAATLDDVLQRRTHVAIEDREHGTGAAGRVAEVMARELGWDEAGVARQIADYESLAPLLAVPDLRAPLVAAP
jgi:glycerol-3-phosphate dehydrogenase